MHGITLTVHAGETTPSWGRTARQSTLARILAGHPTTKSPVAMHFRERRMADLLVMEPHERAKAGVFLAFQYPVDAAGVSNVTFLCGL